MTTAIMKVGTLPSGCYMIWGNKPVSKYNIGDRIKFKSTSEYDGDLVNWSTGRITGFAGTFGDMAFVERF